LASGNSKVIAPLIAKGVNSRVEGQPRFDYGIELLDDTVSLQFSIQSQLNKDITLNGGRIILEDDLCCADNVSLLTTGSVQLNGNSFEFGGFYDKPLTGTITWIDAADISLSGDVKLTGEWLFTENTIINGNGNSLDVSNLGSLLITDGFELRLSNIRIMGLVGGSIVFGNPGSAGGTEAGSIVMTDVTLDLAESFTFGHGTVYVTSPSTIILGDNSLSFTGDANLTVNKTSLWLDPLATWTFPPLGQLYVPNAIYSQYPDYDANIVSNLASGNFTLLSSGTVKLTDDAFTAYNTYAHRAISPWMQAILVPSLSGDHVLDQSLHLFASDQIHVTDDASIDGDGAAARPLHVPGRFFG